MRTSGFQKNAVILPLADVKVAETPLEEMAFRDAVNLRLASTVVRNSTDPRHCVEACSSQTLKLLSRVHCHPFVLALRTAYAEHRPLRLSPDMIWLLICQGVAQHIHSNAEELRHHFVQHQGKVELAIVLDSERFHRGSPENPWPEATELFSQHIASYIGDKHAWFAANFSTTSAAEKAAFEIVLMDAVEVYFRFRLGRVICGIPWIELEGTVEDWDSISDRLLKFQELGLDWWIKPLGDILRQFRAAVGGTFDSAFWNSIYRIYRSDVPCSPEAELGWFAVLFPYLSSTRSKTSLQRSPWLTESRSLVEMLNPDATIRGLRGDRYRGLMESTLPTGLSRVPFLWRDWTAEGDSSQQFSMEFIAGFFGVSQDSSTMCLRPEIGWAVRNVPDRD